MSQSKMKKETDLPEEKKQDDPIFIAIVHHWWMDSGRFEVITLKATTADAADDEATLYAHRKTSTFNHCCAKVMELKPGIMIDNKINRIPLWIRALFNAH